LHSPARRKLLRVVALMLALVTTRIRSEIAVDDPERHLRQTLRQLAFRLFPHDGLPAAPYEEIATALVSRAATDTMLAEMLEAGVAKLDAGSPTPWLERAEAEQLAVIRRLQGGGFFRTMRTTTIEHLYRDKAVWKLVGYEGSSVEYGGYVDRGFDDIDWLPVKSGEQ
jgi:hypothetical protein